MITLHWKPVLKTCVECSGDTTYEYFFLMPSPWELNQRSDQLVGSLNSQQMNKRAQITDTHHWITWERERDRYEEYKEEEEKSKESKRLTLKLTPSSEITCITDNKFRHTDSSLTWWTVQETAQAKNQIMMSGWRSEGVGFSRVVINDGPSNHHLSPLYTTTKKFGNERWRLSEFDWIPSNTTVNKKWILASLNYHPE